MKSNEKVKVLGEIDFSELGVVSDLKSLKSQVVTQGLKINHMGFLVLERALKAESIVELDKLTKLGLLLISEAKPVIDVLLKESSIILQFLGDYGKFDEVRTAFFYDSYADWCVENGHRQEGKQKFFRELERLGFKRLATSHSRGEKTARVIRWMPEVSSEVKEAVEQLYLE